MNRNGYKYLQGVCHRNFNNNSGQHHMTNGYQKKKKKKTFQWEKYIPDLEKK